MQLLDKRRRDGTDMDQLILIIQVLGHCCRMPFIVFQPAKRAKSFLALCTQEVPESLAGELAKGQGRIARAFFSIVVPTWFEANLPWRQQKYREAVELDCILALEQRDVDFLLVLW